MPQVARFCPRQPPRPSNGSSGAELGPSLIPASQFSGLGHPPSSAPLRQLRGAPPGGCRLLSRRPQRPPRACANTAAGSGGAAGTRREPGGSGAGSGGLGASGAGGGQDVRRLRRCSGPGSRDARRELPRCKAVAARLARTTKRSLAH